MARRIKAFACEPAVSDFIQNCHGYSVDGGCRNGVHRNHRNGGERHGGERRGGERHGGYADGRGNGGGSGNRSGNGAADGSFQNCGFVNLRGPPPKGPAVKRAQRS